MPSKPWTPYAKSFEAAVELLKQGTAAAPFASMADAGVWIAERKFIDVISTDLEAESLIEAIVSEKLRDYRLGMNNPGIRWELHSDASAPTRFAWGGSVDDETSPGIGVHRRSIDSCWSNSGGPKLCTGQKRNLG